MTIRILARRHAKRGVACDACGRGAREKLTARLMVQAPDGEWREVDVCRPCLMSAAHTATERAR